MKIEDGLPVNPLDEPVETRVARGAALLDEKVPDWRTRVNPDTLHMSLNSACVIGQLFGWYADGLRALEITGRVQATRYGFDLVGSEEGTGALQDFPALTDAWRAVLTSTPTV